MTDSQNYATIQIPTAGSQDPQRFPCWYQGVDGKRLALTATERVPSFTAVTVEYNDALFLGEVMACTEDVTHTWHIEVKVEQVLSGLQSLMNLRANLLGEPVPAPVRMAQAVVTH